MQSLNAGFSSSCPETGQGRMKLVFYTLDSNECKEGKILVGPCCSSAIYSSWLSEIYLRKRGLPMLHSCRRVETSASGRYKREGEFFKFFMIIFYDSIKASGGGGRL